MRGTTRTTTVMGNEFEVWSDFIYRGTFAKNIATGETKCIKDGGYVHNDLSVRKAIANVFGFESFRK